MKVSHHHVSTGKKGNKVSVNITGTFLKIKTCIERHIYGNTYDISYFHNKKIKKSKKVIFVAEPSKPAYLS